MTTTLRRFWTFCSNLLSNSAAVVTITLLFTLITFSCPKTINKRDTRPSSTIFRNEYMRLLQRQSCINSVVSSNSTTTDPLSPQGLTSVPLDPTVLRMQNLAALIQAVCSAVIFVATLTKLAWLGLAHRRAL